MTEIFCRHLYDMPEQDLRIAMVADKDDYKSFITEVSKYCFERLQDKHPHVRQKQALLEDSVIAEEIKRVMGQILKTIQTLPQQITILPGFQTKMQNIAELYHQMKGKGKVEAVQAHPATVVISQEAPTETTAQREVTLFKPTKLSMLREKDVEFLPAARIGEGAFGIVCKAKVLDEDFLDDVYAVKCIKRGDGIMTPNMLAAHEATSVPLSHRGIIHPLALVKHQKRPMVIYKYWNGGHIDHWIQILKSDSSRPMSRDFVDTVGTPTLFIDNIIPIINGLLRTIEFMHDHDFGHNDLHGRNILLHFGSKVYVGLADWGKADNYPTDSTFPPIPDDTKKTIEEYSQRFKHVAPESFSTNPPPYSKAQEIYSISYQIRRLILCLHKPEDPLLANFYSHVYKWADAGLNPNPNKRPDAFSLLTSLAGAQRAGLDIVKASGLRPFNE